MIPWNLPGLALLALSLTGCPPAPPAGEGAQGGSPPGAEAPHATAGDAAPPPPAGGGLPLPPGAPPGATFEQVLATGAPSVTLHIVVEGLSRGQIDFSTFEGDGKNGRARSVHVQRFETSTFDVVAPANFERKLVVSAVPVGEGGLLGDDGAAAVANGEVVIGAEDQTITLAKPVL